MSKKQYELPSEIIQLSEAEHWDEARLEWDFVWCEKQDDPDNCLCGHEIFNICTIRNRLNRNEATVGVCCVLKFRGERADLILKAHKKIESDIRRALNPEAIDHAERLGWISKREKDFYFDTWRKKKLSESQIAWRVAINRRVLNAKKRMQEPSSGSQSLDALVASWSRQQDETSPAELNKGVQKHYEHY